jgi:hypothetical protein
VTGIPEEWRPPYGTESGLQIHHGSDSSEPCCVYSHFKKDLVVFTKWGTAIPPVTIILVGGWMDARRGFEAQRMRELRNGALAVSVFLFGMVPWRLTGAPGPGPMNLLAWHAGCWGLLVFMYAVWLHHKRYRIRGAERPAFGLMLIGLGVTGSQLFMYGRLQETASILIVSLASGVVLQRRAALTAFQAILLVTWGCLAIHVAGTAGMATWIFDVVLAVLFSFLLHHLLTRSVSALVRRIERQRKLLHSNAALVVELRQAMQNVQTLSGLIPICAHCKKIRNDEGFWEQVESYFRARSEAQFTHGICPECAEVMRDELKSLV